MKDPAFLYYDGDAARDVSHMNRLERGCYFDLIQAQRKFGRLSVEIVKKILGKDFETCWDSVKICLSYDNDMYFIEWLENSTIKRKEYSESRRKNRMAEKQEDIKIISESYVNHMENKNEIVTESISKGGAGGNLSFQEFGQLKEELLTSDAWIEATGIRHKLTPDQVREWIELFVADLTAKEDTGRLLKDYKQHCVNWIGTELKKEGKLNGKIKEFTYNEAIDLIQAGKAHSFSKSFIKKGEKFILK